MDRFNEDLRKLSKRAKLANVDIAKAERILDHQQDSSESSSIINRRMEETTVVLEQLKESVQGTTTLENDLINLINIMDDEDVKTARDLLTKAKEELRLDILATQSNNMIVRLEQKKMELSIEINKRYLSDDDSIHSTAKPSDGRGPKIGRCPLDSTKPTSNMSSQVDSLQHELQMLREQLAELRRAQNTTNTIGHRPALSIDPLTPKVKRPQLSLPTFDGTQANFSSYWTAFQTVIHNDPELSPREKALYLGESLKGRAREHIRGVVLSETTYYAVIETLKTSYQSHIPEKWRVYNQLAAMKPAGNSSQEAQQKARDIRCLLDQLAVMNIYESDEVAWITTIIHQFPPLIVEKVFQNQEAHKYIGTVMTEIEKQTVALANMETYRASRTTHSTSPQKDDKKKKLFPTCSFCDKPGHKSFQCKTVCSPEERRNAAKTKKLCWKCFNSNHASKDCRMSDCPNCNQPHHSTLCMNAKKGKNTATRPESKPTIATLTHITWQPQRATLMTARIQVQTNNAAESKTIIAFFDTGATRSFILEQKANELGLETHTPSRQLHTTGFANTNNIFQSRTVIIRLKSAFGHDIQLHTQTAPTLTNNITNAKLSQNDINFILQHNFKLANQEVNGEPIIPDLLIGMDFFTHLVYGEPVVLPSGLRLQPTVFGMAICGTENHLGSYNPEEQVNTIIIDNQECSEKRMLKELFELDSLGIKPEDGTLQKADEFYNMYGKSMTFNAGHIIAPLPLKDNFVHLKNNYRVAGKILYRIMESLQKKPEQLFWYKKVMRDYLQQGIIEIAPPRQTEMQYYFMPHRGVWNENKKTPLRIVFNCSSKMRGELSLNEVLHTGNSYVNKILDILITSRSRPYFICCDIQSAFTQIRLAEEHKRFCHFLWLKEEDKPANPSNIIEMRFNRIVFGMTTSPSILNIGLTSFLKQKKQKIAEEMLKNIYVDNILMTATSTEECFEKYQESKHILQSIDMNLREYFSNDENVNKKIPEEDRYPNKTMKLLGITYNRTSDQFHMKIEWQEKERYTKRELLSRLHSLYDPMGFAAPLMVQFKQILREVFEMKIEWTAQVPQELCIRWNKVLAAINNQEININRALPYSEKPGTIWIFADASTIATAVCAYYVSHNTRSQIIVGKTKLAPKNRILTIPRLELIALHMAANLAQTIMTAMNRSFINIHILSDSQIALSWLKTKHSLPTFVANLRDKFNRVLKNLSDQGANINISYVDTKHNPADIGSRGSSDKKFQGSFWIQGPEWLTKSPSQWPIIPFDDIMVEHETGEEIYNITTLTDKEASYEEPFPTLSSKSLNEVLRIIVRITRWKEKASGLMAPVTGTEMERARKTIIRAHQYQLQAQIREKEPRAFKDSEGVWRIASRISNLEIPFEVRNPILLNKKSSLTKQIIMDIHQENHHIGTEHTLALFKREYHTISPRQCTKSIISKCQACKLRKLKPYSPTELGPLPSDRTKADKVFQHTGVDALGPIKYVKDKKVYVILFTCLTVRAIHLEIVQDLSGEAFILAFSRFISRRGVPTIMRSDNGGNFLMADNILKLLHEPTSVDGKSIISFIAHKKIKWIFNTPGAPWTGGAWERLVRSVKNSLQKGVNARKLNVTQLSTVLCKVEAIINSRPLTYVATEGLAIRPIDFIIPQAKLEVFNSDELNINQTDYADVDVLGRQKALESLQRVELCLQKLWERFLAEYLPNLRNLYGLGKGKDITSSPRIGDIVLIKEDRMRKGEWSLGRIIEVMPGTDSIIRTARVLQQNGHICSKPVSVLYPTELRSETSIMNPTTLRKHQHIKRTTIPYMVPEHLRQQKEGQVEEEEDEENQESQEPHDDQEQTKEINIAPTPSNREEQQRRIIKAPSIDKTPDTEKGETIIVKGSVATPPARFPLPTREESFRRFKWKPLITIITFFTLVSVSQADVNCTNGLLSISELAKDVKICIDNHCRTVLRKTNLTINLPVQAHNETHLVSFEINQKKSYLNCAGTELCQHATFMSAHLLGNPHCSPCLALLSTLIPMLVIATTIAITIGAIQLFCKTKPSEPYQPSLLQTATLLALLTLSRSAAACHPAAQKNHIAYTCNNGSCEAELNKEIILNAGFRTLCVTITAQNVVISNHEIELMETVFLCHKKTHFFTRETIGSTQYNLGCPGSNRCNLFKKCDDYHGSIGEELFDGQYRFPGTMNCIEVAAGPFGGCPIPGRACLIFRVGHEPTNNDVYEIFSCAAWSREHIFQIVSTELGKTPTKKIIRAKPYERIQTSHFSLTVDLSTEHALEQYTTERFIRTSKATAILPAHISPKVTCATQDQAQHNFSTCAMSEECICASTARPPRCQCTNMAFNHVRQNYLLPRKGRGDSISTIGTTIQVQSRKEELAVAMESTAVLEKQLKNSGSECTIQVEQLSGCYNCEKGMLIQLSCWAQEPETQITMCQDQLFIIECSPDRIVNKLIFFADVPKVKMNCTTHCGTKKIDTTIEKVLAFIPEQLQLLENAEAETTTRKPRKQGWFDDIHIPDLNPLKDLINIRWKEYVSLAFLIVIIVVIIIVLGPRLFILILEILLTIIQKTAIGIITSIINGFRKSSTQ